MKSPKVNGNETIRDFFGVKRLDVPNDSVVCCHTESPEKTPDTIPNENDTPLLNSQQKVMINILRNINNFLGGIPGKAQSCKKGKQ